MPTVYPCVPGHEIVGRVTKVGTAVTKFKRGDLAGVGCLVDSCSTCPECRARASSSSARTGPSPTTRRTSTSAASPTAATPTASSSTRTFVLRVPTRTSISPGRAAPLRRHHHLLAAAPLEGRQQGQEGRRRRPRRARPHGREVRPRVRAHVVSSPPRRAREDALRLGAHEVVVSRNADEMAKHAGQLRLHPRHRLRRSRPQRLPRPPAQARRHADPGRCPREAAPRRASSASSSGRRLAGSIIGGIRETQEMLDFCAEHGITADVEVIPIQKVNEAYERLLKGDVKYRFSIDMASLEVRVARRSRRLDQRLTGPPRTGPR